jgi:diacylglycerol O-acyltransferase / wax synthase
MTQSTEQLGGLDAAFVYCETPTTHLHVCGLMVLDTSTMSGGYSFERLRSMLADRLPTVSAVRHRLSPAPLHVSRPFWVEDDQFDIDRHLHRVEIGSAGDDRSLSALAGDIASRPLPRDRPLWEMWAVEGLPDRRVALITKMHHSTIDGVSGANVIGALFDLEPLQPPDATSPDGQAAQAARQWEMFAQGLASRLTESWDLVQLIPSTIYRLGSTLWKLRAGSDADGETATPFTAPRTMFNATITARRSVAFTNVPLDAVKRVKNAAGVTVNDVVTAVVGGALRHYLESSGDLPDHSLLAAVPVSVHDQAASNSGTTQVSVMFSSLATDEKDPAERLEIVASSNRQAKKVNKMVGADTLLRWSQHFWLNGFGLGARLYSAWHLADHHPVVHNLILSNVPGPPVPLYMAGARLVGLYPLGPIMDGAGLNITVLSQEDRIGFGFITCPDLVPDVWELAAAVPGALEELVDAVA